MEPCSQKWLLTFHPRKCHVLALGKFYNITHTEKYTFQRQELEHVFEQKDLGVILNAELKFDEHISAKVKKANAIAGLIRRTFSYVDGPLFKKKIFNYSGKCTTPSHKLVDGFHHMSYSERLKKLNLPSLVYKRARRDMIEIFKHFHSYDNCALPENFRP